MERVWRIAMPGGAVSVVTMALARIAISWGVTGAHGWYSGSHARDARTSCGCDCGWTGLLRNGGGEGRDVDQRRVTGALAGPQRQHHVDMLASVWIAALSGQDSLGREPGRLVRAMRLPGETRKDRMMREAAVDPCQVAAALAGSWAGRDTDEDKWLGCAEMQQRPVAARMDADCGRGRLWVQDEERDDCGGGLPRDFISASGLGICMGRTEEQRNTRRCFIRV